MDVPHIQLPPIFKRPWRFIPRIPLPDFRYVIVSSVESLGTIHPNIYASIFLIVFVGVFVFIKLKYPFWNGEPVFHTYDFWRRWYHSPYIMHKLPIKTKYHQRQNVVTLTADTVTIPQWKQLAEFLQYFSIPSERVLHTITHTQLMSMYQAGHEHSSFVSAILPITEKEMGENTAILASVFSKSVVLHIGGGGASATPTPCYYLDYITTHRNHPDYVRTLFDTHVYRQRRMNPEVAVAVWRQEVTPVAGVVPLVQFSVGTYYLGDVLGRLPPLSPKYQIQRIQSQNAHIVSDCWRNPDLANQFQCILQPATSALVATEKSGVTRVYAFTRGEHIYALYYFKIPQLIYEELGDGKGDGGETIQCVASVCNCKDTPALFYAGFLHCLGDMVKTHKTYQMLLIDWIGHNSYLADFWEKSYPSPICKNLAGYYLYNMIVPASPLQPTQCFVFA